MKIVRVETSYVDDTCEIRHFCDGSDELVLLFIDGDTITRCPKCGKGYRTVFTIAEYATGEIDHPGYTERYPDGRHSQP